MSDIRNSHERINNERVTCAMGTLIYQLRAEGNRCDRSAPPYTE